MGNTRGLVGLTAIALAAGLAIAPAQTASAYVPPTVAGDYTAVTATPFRVISDRGTCSEAVELHAEVDMVGIGAELTNAGLTSLYGDPAYTTLAWRWNFRITGPDGYYSDGPPFSTWQPFPDAEDGWTLRLCPDEYGHGRVLPGAYTMTGTVTVTSGDGTSELCKGADCLRNVQVVQKAYSVPFEVTSTCPQATADYQKVQQAVTKAANAVKKAKNPKAKRKAKRDLTAARSKLATAREVKAAAC